jgi:hypothetical protein
MRPSRGNGTFSLPAGGVGLAAESRRPALAPELSCAERLLELVDEQWGDSGAEQAQAGEKFVTEYRDEPMGVHGLHR